MCGCVHVCADVLPTSTDTSLALTLPTSSPGFLRARYQGCPPRAAPGSVSGTRATAPCARHRRPAGSATHIHTGKTDSVCTGMRDGALRPAYAPGAASVQEGEGVGLHRCVCTAQMRAQRSAGQDTPLHTHTHNHLCGEEHEVGVGLDHLVQLRHKQLAVVVQQPDVCMVCVRVCVRGGGRERERDQGTNSSRLSPSSQRYGGLEFRIILAWAPRIAAF